MQSDPRLNLRIMDTLPASTSAIAYGFNILFYLDLIFICHRLLCKCFKFQKIQHYLVLSLQVINIIIFFMVFREYLIKFY
jgi:hypothetical protein